MSNITFGTDGWRAIIANDFNCYNISRVTTAIVKWLTTKHTDKPITVVLGNDCRFMGKHFANLIANLLADGGIHVILQNSDFVSTPIISLATKRLGAQLGIIITASHNPYYYSGIKLKASYGGPLDAESVKEIEDLIPKAYKGPIILEVADEHIKKELVTYKDLNSIYLTTIASKISIEPIIRESNAIVYDAMYGASQHILKALFNHKVQILHDTINPNFNYGAPEPIEKNLKYLQQLVKENSYKCGIGIDGDADRLAIFDENGAYVSSHKIIMLLIMFLHEYKNMKGAVITTFSCSDKIKQLCQLYNINHLTTKIGFKYICKLMAEDPKQYILGAEESGGMALSDYIPERDGIFISLNIITLILESRLPLSELVNMLYKKVGHFSTDRKDLRINNEEKQIIEQKLKGDFYSLFTNKVSEIEDLDGIKFRFEDKSWVMVRLSGTEPIIRIYSEAETDKLSRLLIEETSDIIQKISKA